jgi:hypothetical protein
MSTRRWQEHFWEIAPLAIRTDSALSKILGVTTSLHNPYINLLDLKEKYGVEIQQS